jgi:hypothetical protein
MKNQYFGDLNDYHKYGLLRILSGAGEICTGVCWMLTPSDGLTHGDDTGYLDRRGRWEAFDPELYEFLHRRLIEEGERDVRLLENSGILPNTFFYTPILAESPDERRRYFREMVERFRGADLIFFDPDNGLEVGSVQLGARGSSKYLYWHELAETYCSGHSVLVYQHFPRKPRDAFIDRIAEGVRSHTSADARIYSFRTSKVVFFLASRPEHTEQFGRRAEEVSSVWGDQIRALRH